MITGPLSADSLGLLHRALLFWQQQGFVFVDLPWIIPGHFTRMTRPPERREISTFYGNLVASGEQSFLKLFQNKRLVAAPGYVGWSPCFRDEPWFDELHQFAFIKAECFVPFQHRIAGKIALSQLLSKQQQLFISLAKLHGSKAPIIEQEVVKHDQIDLCLGGIEIGSYGVREFEGCQYLYGTALALPRFTTALDRAAGTPATSVPW